MTIIAPFSWIAPTALSILFYPLFLLCWFIHLYAFPLPSISKLRRPFTGAARRWLSKDWMKTGKAVLPQRWTWQSLPAYLLTISHGHFTQNRTMESDIILANHPEQSDTRVRRHESVRQSTIQPGLVGSVAPGLRVTTGPENPKFIDSRYVPSEHMETSLLQKISAPQIYHKASSLVNLWQLRMRKCRGRPFALSYDLNLFALDARYAVIFGLGDKDILRQEIDHIQPFSEIVSLTRKDPVSFPRPTLDPEVEALLDTESARGSSIPILACCLHVLDPRSVFRWLSKRSFMRRHVERRMRRLRRLASVNSKGPTKEAGGEECVLDYILIREISTAHEPGRQPSLHSRAIRDELGFILGGHSTTAILLCWWVKYMITHQLVQDRLRQELQVAFSDAAKEVRCPTAAEINDKSIPYLCAVIAETLRCAPLETLIDRPATYDGRMLGSPTSRGPENMAALATSPSTGPVVPVVILPFMPQSQKRKSGTIECGDDKTLYQPERWLKRVQDDITGAYTIVFNAQSGSEMAFSRESRQCFTKGLSELELRITIILLLWNFTLRSVDTASAEHGVVETNNGALVD